MAGSDDSWTTEAEDAATESAVLTRVIELHPTQVTVAELAREIAGSEPPFAERDAVERAVRDLVGAGLLRRSGELVQPTRAALRFSQLADR